MQEIAFTLVAISAQHAAFVQDKLFTLIVALSLVPTFAPSVATFALVDVFMLVVTFVLIIAFMLI